jgi:subtilisin family serine protease
MRAFFCRAGAFGVLVGVVLFVGGAAVGAPPPKGTLAPVTSAGTGPSFVPGQLVVRFEQGATAAEVSQALGGAGATKLRDLPLPGVQLLKVSGKTVEQAAAAMAKNPRVRYAEPNWLYEPQAIPNDPQYGSLWGLTKISAPAAWDQTTGSASIVVADVDTGITLTHPDLAPNLYTNSAETAGDGIDNDSNGFVDDVHGWDFVGHDNVASDTQGHGSHTAGTIGAVGNNGVGVAGVNWTTRIMPLRVCGATGCSNADVTSAFAYAGANGAKVANASLGGGGFSQAMSDAVAAHPNTLYVISAGNGGDDGVGDNNDTTPTYPCSMAPANIICVAATDPSDALASFSNYGATSVDLSAPGTGVVSTFPAWSDVTTDGFEAATGWTASGSPNTWARTTEAVPSGYGSYSATDSPGANYVNSATNYFTRDATYDLSARSGCRAQYLMRLQTEYQYDYFKIDTSPDGSTWTNRQQWTGETPNYSLGYWYSYSTELSALDGAAAARIRMGLTSDSSIVYDGAHIDGFTVQCLAAGGGYATLQGTSMAAPHVTGVAALVWAKYPTASAADVKAAILQGVDPVAGLSGKVVSGGRLNALGALNRICNGKLVTIIGTPGADTLNGTAGADVIAGLGGEDTINGGGGNDTICGGAGNDSLRGGAGADSLNGDDGADTLDYSAAPSAIGANMETHTAWGGEGSDSFTGMENLTGSGFADTVVADAGPNVLSGGDGNDTLRGGAGNDTLAGGNGFDIVDYNGAGGSVIATLAGSATGGAGSDSLSGFESIVGSPFADTITGDGLANTLVGGAGNDTIWAGGGNDHLRGGPGADALHGEVGIDALDYATSPTAVTVSLLAGTASGGGGADTFDGMEYIFGSPFGDILTGSNEHNRIDGIDGNDQIFGLAGADALFGSAGVDTIDGGLDIDKCVSGEVLTSCETTS